MDGSKRAVDPSIYTLCPLIENIDFGMEEEKDRTEIRCVAALGKNIYLGCSNGKLMSYTLEESIDGTSKYTLTSQITLRTRSPILSLQLAPTLSKALVLSDDTLSFLSLPRLDPVPAEIMRSMKNALLVAINETPAPMEPVGLVIVKRSGISFWEMGNKMHFVRELPAPGVMHVRRTGASLCIADLENYIIIDLQSLSQLPLHPISLSETWKILPKIEVVQHDEYLMVACTGTSSDFGEVYTMGLFVNGRGEPTRSPMEWRNAPEAVCVQGEMVVSLHTTTNPHATVDSGRGPASVTPMVVEVRKAGESNLLQAIPLPTSKLNGNVTMMTLARDGFVAPVNSRQEKLLLVPVQLSHPLPPLPPPPPPPPLAQQGQGGQEGQEVPTISTEGRKTEGGKDGKNTDDDGGLDEPAGSGLTPPPTPKKPTRAPSSHTPAPGPGLGPGSGVGHGVRHGVVAGHGHSRSQSRNANGASTIEGARLEGGRVPGAASAVGAGAGAGAGAAPIRFPTSKILLATKNSVMALLPSTLLSQVEEMLEDGKVKDAAAFLGGVQGRHAKDEDLVADFRFLNLRIGIAYLFQTAFEDAGDALFRGELDPRWIMGLWEEWAAVVRDSANRANKNGAAKDSAAPVMVDVYSGLQPDLYKLKGTTIKQIVANYSPHLKPSTAESAAGQELQMTLEWSAREMLAKYLRKFRTRRQFVGEQMGGMYTDEMVNRAVDTVSVMLYVQATDPEELHELRSLLDESPFIALDDVREPLVQNGHISSLARIYEKRNDQPALIDLYVKVADGVWKDESISDPVGKAKKLLQSSKDRGLVQKYALWLLKRDRSGGLKLLISNESRRPTSSVEDTNLLSQIREVDARAGVKFLEYLVLQKKTPDASLHTQLITSYLDALIHHLEDPKVAESQRATIDGYLESASRPSRPFLFHLAFETPDSDHKRVRLKLALMLQGSNFYDLEGIRRKLRVQETNLRSLLCLETAILDAKAGDHKAALSILVNNLQDFISAEAYCSLGGRVITPKIAAAIGDRLSLGDWAALVLASDGPGGGSIHGNVGRVRRQGSSSSLGVNGARGGPSPDARGSPEPRKAMELTRMLLEVYMKAGESRATEASRLLNAQAVNLDALDIIPQMPASWSLDLVSSFLSRSFRRSLHEVYEGQILKQLSAGQNLQTSELAFEAFSAAGAMIEESNGDEQDRLGGDHDLEKADSENEEKETPGAAELKELGSRIEEKLAEKRRLDHADTRPGEVRVGKTGQ